MRRSGKVIEYKYFVLRLFKLVLIVPAFSGFNKVLKGKRTQW